MTFRISLLGGLRDGRSVADRVDLSVATDRRVRSTMSRPLSVGRPRVSMSGFGVTPAHHTNVVHSTVVPSVNVTWVDATRGQMILSVTKPGPSAFIPSLDTISAR
jgi:hypothetical protein